MSPTGEGPSVSTRTERTVVVSAFFVEASMPSVSGQFSSLPHQVVLRWLNTRADAGVLFTARDR